MMLGSVLAKAGAEVDETRSSGARYCPRSELHPNNVEEIWGSGKRLLRGGAPSKAAEGGEDRSSFLYLPLGLSVERGRWLLAQGWAG